MIRANNKLWSLMYHDELIEAPSFQRDPRAAIGDDDLEGGAGLARRERDLRSGACRPYFSACRAGSHDAREVVAIERRGQLGGDVEREGRRGAAGRLDPGDPITGRDQLVAIAGQEIDDAIAQAGLVFDHEDPQGKIVPRSCVSRT